MREIQHPLRRSVGRGLKGRCPACGEGKMFWRYLKVSDRCPKCDLDLSNYPADDGPAYLTILLIGHMVIVPLLLFPIIWRSPAIYSVPIVLVALTAITLTALPVIKGGWIGLMYSLGVCASDSHLHTADAVD
jgi:uncharacterized protein (DUF983 family)